MPVLRTAETMEGQVLLEESGPKNEEEFSAVQCSVPLLSGPGIQEQVLRVKGPDGGPRRCQGLHLNPCCVPSLGHSYRVPEHNPHRDTGSLGQSSEGHLDTNQGKTSYIWNKLMREREDFRPVCCLKDPCVPRSATWKGQLDVNQQRPSHFTVNIFRNNT